MAEILIVVHANSTWNELGLWQGQCDTPLSQTGLKMAKSLAESEYLTRIRKIYSSDLKRAYATAEPLAKKLGLALVMEPGLREGRWADHHMHASAPLLPATYDYESRKQLQQRAVDTLNFLALNNTEFPILVLTHGSFLECFIDSLGNGHSNQYEGIRTAINSFDFDGEQWRVRFLNEASHLPQIEQNMICVTNKAPISS